MGQYLSRIQSYLWRCSLWIGLLYHLSSVLDADRISCVLCQDVDTIYLTQDTRELNLQDFSHLENR